MGEVLKEESEEEKKEEIQTEEPTEIELQAMELGWKPKDEFDESTGKKWRSAEDFMDRKPFFDKIEEVKRENKRLKDGLDHLAKHNANIEKASYDRAFRELKQERAAAIEEGDIKKAEAIRDEMDVVKERAANIVVPTIPAPSNEFLNWKEENTWYESDESLTIFADGLAQKLAHKGVSPPDILKEVERKVKDAFPQKFRNLNKDRAPIVEPQKRTVKVNSIEGSMPKTDLEIMNKILAVGGLTKEAYLKQYALVNQK